MFVLEGKEHLIQDSYFAKKIFDKLEHAAYAVVDIAFEFWFQIRNESLLCSTCMLINSYRKYCAKYYYYEIGCMYLLTYTINTKNYGIIKNLFSSLIFTYLHNNKHKFLSVNYRCWQKMLVQSCKSFPSMILAG